MAVASSDPTLFCTLHLYTAPFSPLIRFVRVRILDEESAALLPCLVQAMLGGGLPVALQNRVTSLPSTVCLDDGAESTSAGSISFETIIVLTYQKMNIIHVSTQVIINIAA